MRYRIPILIAIVAMLASSCVLSNYARVPDYPYGTAPSYERGGEDYYYPDFTAEMKEPAPGTFTITWQADHRSSDAALAAGIVKINGETVFYAGLASFGGQYTFDVPPGEWRWVEVYASYIEGTPLLWQGWVSN